MTANGGNRGVGIGGGANGAGGTVNITGGTVTATGKNGGAGIGGGSGGSGGTLTISGGTVTATGSIYSYDGSSGAGIGGGSGGSGGTLKISGGSVKANNMEGINASVPVDSDGNFLEQATLTLKDGSPLYKAALDDVGNTIRSDAGSLYAYGTTDVITDAKGRVYFYLPADTYSISLQAGGKPYVNKSVEVASGSNQAVLNLERILESITPLATVTGVANGTTKGAEALGLPANVTLVTDIGSVSAGVAWDVDACSYDPASIAEQTFTVNGTATLPDGVLNPNDVSLNVSVSVTVSAAAVAPSAPSFSEPAYSTRTLTDIPTGLNVSGALPSDATLRVNSFTPTRNTTDPALAAIHKRMDSKTEKLIFCADITISGNYSGLLTLSFEVGSQYNGHTVTLLHAKNGTLTTYTAIVINGIATFTVTDLSPFALYAPALNAAGVPNTGDSGTPYGTIAAFGILTLVAGISAVHIRRRYNKEKAN